MSADRILVPIDFTPAANSAKNHAAEFARLSGRHLSLLHVIEAKENPESVRDKLVAYAERIRERYGVEPDIVSVSGTVLHEIEQATREPRYAFMVMPTHGVKGIRQSLFGADALHVARHSAVPVLMVRENPAEPDYSKIVFPYGGHAQFEHKIMATITIAKAFGSKVHIYSIDRPGDPPTDQALRNVENARTSFKAAGVDFVEVHEEPSMMSMGFARQTLEYASRIGAGMIAVMASKTSEYSHIAQADKETMINNDVGISILFTGDAVTEKV